MNIRPCLIFGATRYKYHEILTRRALGELRPQPRTVEAFIIHRSALYMSEYICSGVIVFLHWLCFVTIDLSCHLRKCRLPPSPNAVSLVSSTTTDHLSHGV